MSRLPTWLRLRTRNSVQRGASPFFRYVGAFRCVLRADLAGHASRIPETPTYLTNHLAVDVHQPCGV